VQADQPCKRERGNPCREQAATLLWSHQYDLSTMSDPRLQKKSILLVDEEETDDVDMDIPTLPETEETGELLSEIITPSPYPQHNDGSSRYANALNRVLQAPDTEAWQALLTEVASCTRSLTVHAVDADTQAKLDWAESCYGHLLREFPYAAQPAATLLSLLLSQSARVGEEGGPSVDYGMSTSRRSRSCEAKVDRLLQELLLGDMAMCSWSVDLWFVYIRKVNRDASRKAAALSSDERQQSVRKAMLEAYDKAVDYAGSRHRNHELWKNFLTYVRSWRPDGDHALAQEQMLQLRRVFQKLVVHPMTGLDQLWAEYEGFERAQNEALAAALIAEWSPKYTHARTIYLERNRVYNADTLQVGRLATPPAEDDVGRKEENQLLTAWKTCCAYERTNPERLTLAELPARLRMIFREMACVLTRHPESWSMWSTWEHTLGAVDSTKKAISVLDIGQSHIPDCTLIAHARAGLHLSLEDHMASLAVWETFLKANPNTLAYVLYQKLVRKYKGIDDARAVFSQARRRLRSSEAMVAKSATEEDGGDEGMELANGDDPSYWTVTNRLHPSIGNTNGDKLKVGRSDSVNQVTWHLYAAHADIEHRLNKQRDVAGRVYELGLRKHSSFLTKPSYVIRYAQLLLELDDIVNLRALLTRAISACHGEQNEGPLAAMWDMKLYFESLVGGLDKDFTFALSDLEAKRHEAILGPGMEDVASGGIIGETETALVGAQKSSIAEQLVRLEGYDLSSKIVNGLSRMVDLFTLIGCWGNEHISTATSRQKLIESQQDTDDDMPGGKSDRGLQRRLMVLHSGGTAAANGKALSARERMQQTSASGVAQGSAMMLAIQQNPEWLRPLLMMLPLSRMRVQRVPKPPPQTVETALTSLKQGILPAERPAENSKKRGADDSDDEYDGSSGGYGSQFRSRQRARQQAKAMDVS